MHVFFEKFLAMACMRISHPYCSLGSGIRIAHYMQTLSDPLPHQYCHSYHSVPRNRELFNGGKFNHKNLISSSGFFRKQRNGGCFGTKRSWSSVYVAASETIEQKQAPIAAGKPLNVLDILEERGLVESIAGEDLRNVCSKTFLKVYCGFDPTADSLHLGHLLGIVVLSWFQRCGHTPVVVLGGATARVGDPSGKSIERPVLDEEAVEKNLQGIRKNLMQVLKVDSVEQNGDNSNHINNASQEWHSPVILNNYDWWKTFSLLEFLRDVGKYARVGTMIAKEMVKKRLSSDEGISYTEFTYQLLQGYDFVHLYKEEGVSVQVGGSDQWGNITTGIELVRKMLQQDDAYGLTFPLLLKSDGTKFGKSEGGAIWLSPLLLSPYQFYQYLFATPDCDVANLMKMLTFVSMEKIRELEMSMTRPDYVPNTAQKMLAAEVTRFVHGEDGLEDALKATKALAPGSETTLDWRAIEAISQDVPSCMLSEESILGPLVDLCVKVGLLPSKGAVRRLIKQGGLYINNAKVEQEERAVELSDIIDKRILLISAGKKNKIVIRVKA